MGIVARLLCIALFIRMCDTQSSGSGFRQGAIVEERGEVVLVNSYIYVRVKSERTAKVPSYLYKLIVVLDELERNVEKVDGSKSKTYEVAMYDKLGQELKTNIMRVKQKAEDLYNWFQRQEIIVHLMVDCCSGDINNSEFIWGLCAKYILIYCSLGMSAKD